MKKLLIEILIISVLATVLALVFNAFQPKPFPLTPLSKQEKTVQDSALYEIDSGSVDLSKEVSYEQMLKIVKDDNFVVIDARPDYAFDKGNIENSRNIHPYSEIKILATAIMDLPRDKKYIIYCDGGTCDLSHELATELMGHGFTKIFLYMGGWEEWATKQNIPIED